MSILNTNLTDDEYVRSLHDKRALSPIIDELCTRLEQATDNDPADSNVCCPVCEAPLLIEWDDEGKLELKANG